MYLIKDWMSKLGYGHKVECCAAIKSLWSESAPGALNGYWRPPRPHRLRN